ncbi:hypothetical protein D3C87_101670 [compost metagenome]
MRYIFVFLMLFTSVSAWAVQFQAKKTPRSTATAESEVKLLTDLVACVKTGKTVKGIHLCSKSLFPAMMSKADRHRLLAWFELPVSLAYPKKCTEAETEFVLEEQKAKAKHILCSSYDQAGLNKKVLFFIGEESGTLRLLNIKD